MLKFLHGRVAPLMNPIFLVAAIFESSVAKAVYNRRGRSDHEQNVPRAKAPASDRLGDVELEGSPRVARDGPLHPLSFPPLLTSHLKSG